MTMPLQWTIVATQVPPGGSLGGVVRYTTELMTALAEREDVIVSALTTAAAADTVRDLMGGGTVHTVPNAPVPLLSIVERHAPLKGLRRGPDVVHGMKHLVPRRSEALRVLTVHDMLLLDRSDDFGLVKRMLLPPPYRASIRDADLLICVSEATRQRLDAQIAGSAARAQVVHLATSRSLQLARPRPLEALAGRRFALVVGDSSPRKNLATVMQAWDRVRVDHPDVVLAVAGPPSWGATAVGELYQGLVDAGAVLSVGHVDDDELRWAYENADLVVCPSLVEGFGLPAAEALSFGACVVISDDPALVEVAAGRARAIVPPLAVSRWADEMAAALQQPGRSAVTTGRSWADVAEETVAAVRGALASRRPAAIG